MCRAALSRTLELTSCDVMYDRTHSELRPPSAASWIRRSLATSLRSRHPYSVNLLLGGYDVPLESPHLYWIDYLGTLATVPYAAHGYGAFFALATLDAHWEEDMDRERGVEVLKMCLNEVKKRASAFACPAPPPFSSARAHLHRTSSCTGLIVDVGEIKVKLVDKDIVLGPGHARAVARPAVVASTQGARQQRAPGLPSDHHTARASSTWPN